MIVLKVHVPVSLLEQNQYVERWEYLSKYSGKVATPSKRQSVGKQQRSRSTSRERKSQSGVQSITYQLGYYQGALTVNVLECQNLKKTDNRGSTDAYVEISLLPATQKPEKTKHVKNSSNPVFNHTVNYEVSLGLWIFHGCMLYVSLK